MPRYPRLQSSSSIYHIMLRGNERKDIFGDNEDRIRFLDTLQRMREGGNYEVFAYCLMSNHVHLLMREGKESIQRSMKRISVSYVYYFNKKYHRVGHLFQDRYKSEGVEEDAYILAAARYIHNNPVKAGMVEKAEDYSWSSYMQYIRPDRHKENLIVRGFLLSMLSDKEERAVELFKEYTSETAEDTFIEYKEADEPLSVKENISKNVKHEIVQILEKHGQSLESLKGCKDKRIRNQLLREIKEATNASVRELSRLIGISKDIIFRA